MNDGGRNDEGFPFGAPKWVRIALEEVSMLRKTLRVSRVFPVLLVLLMASPSWGADVIPCIAPHVNSAVAVSEAGAVSARIYFRKQGTANWHFIDLKSGPSGFYGVLPRPEQGTAIDYQVETTDASGSRKKGPETAISPSPSCQPVLSPEETNLASNLVVGKTADEASDVPVGFECFGIVGALNSAGELRPVICKKRGILLPVIGAAAVVGGGILIYDNNRGRQGEQSRSRP
jgi:hypothetical protein